MRISLRVRSGASGAMKQLRFAALTQSASHATSQQVGSVSQIALQHSASEQPGVRAAV
jgi:hypothetical protein